MREDTCMAMEVVHHRHHASSIYRHVAYYKYNQSFKQSWVWLTQNLLWYHNFNCFSICSNRSIFILNLLPWAARAGSSHAATVASLAPPTPTVFSSIFDSSSTHYFGPKFSIKLRENNYLIWNQQVGGVILTYRVHKLVVNP